MAPGGPGTDEVRDIAFAPDGTGFIVGYYQGSNTCGFGTDPPEAATRDLFIDRL
jgi:hypothetical protein